ncbi:MAG: hypothetical protein JRJ87_01775 [Deltaproteobacteria bacterium]|nr:hypothetical protein [Deltaproteobacteria bacterium]
MKTYPVVIVVLVVIFAFACCDHPQRCDKSLFGQQLSDLPKSEYCTVYGSARSWSDSPACDELTEDDWTCIDVRAPMIDGIGYDRFGNECGTGDPPGSYVVCNVWADPETGQIVCVNYWCPD